MPVIVSSRTSVVLPDDVDVAIVGLQLEVAMIRSQPGIQHLLHEDFSFVNVKDPRRRLAAMTRVAFDLQHHHQLYPKNGIDFIQGAASSREMALKSALKTQS